MGVVLNVAIAAGRGKCIYSAGAEAGYEAMERRIRFYHQSLVDDAEGFADS
jgi:hypothetical protein